MSMASMLNYYDVRGRTWERQAFIKARPVAGDRDLGDEFLTHLSPWIYGRYLSRADIAGIKALKRRIEQQVRGEDQARDVKVGHGGIRDVEFVIQFLQLLNGGDLPELRTGNTLEALARLEACGCLTSQECMLLNENYGFLRIDRTPVAGYSFDLHTHTSASRQIPSCAGWHAHRLRRSARRRSARDAFMHDYRRKRHRSTVRFSIIFCTMPSATTNKPKPRPIWCLIPRKPSPERTLEVLQNYHFRNSGQEYNNLMAAVGRKNPLSFTRRCRQFLAAIASAAVAGGRRYSRSRRSLDQSRPRQRITGRKRRSLGTF